MSSDDAASVPDESTVAPWASEDGAGGDSVSDDGDSDDTVADSDETVSDSDEATTVDAVNPGSVADSERGGSYSDGGGSNSDGGDGYGSNAMYSSPTNDAPGAPSGIFGSDGRDQESKSEEFHVG
uniref:Uncharacterized protein n=2 Tax=Lygus hesperus TaxID=30085 RepID=A0A0K8SDE7_LYGHE